jgi:hypothetical protein
MTHHQPTQIQPHVAQAAVVLLDTRISGRYPTRAEIVAAGVPDGRYAIAVSRALSAASGQTINPVSLRLAVALLQSNVTVDVIRYAAAS